MRETPQDLSDLQTLLDASYDTAGPHLKEVITPDRRLSAKQLCDELAGMKLLTLATVTADGRPLAGAVDSFFYRGHFWFGSSHRALRMAHVARRPHVSAVYLPGEHLSVTVHGRAYPSITADAPTLAGFREVCVDHYGREWLTWETDAVYAYIVPDKMFTFWMPETP